MCMKVFKQCLYFNAFWMPTLATIVSSLVKSGAWRLTRMIIRSSIEMMDHWSVCWSDSIYGLHGFFLTLLAWCIHDECYFCAHLVIFGLIDMLSDKERQLYTFDFASLFLQLSFHINTKWLFRKIETIRKVTKLSWNKVGWTIFRLEWKTSDHFLNVEA